MNRSLVPDPIRRALPWPTILLLTAMAGFGTLVLYGAAGGSLTPWAGAHMTRFALLLSMAVVISFVPERLVRMGTPVAYAVVLIALIAVELYGAVKGGAQRWLDVGIRLQPSEFMKPMVVLVTAQFYAQLPPSHIRSWRALWPAGLLILMPMGLVLLQPDLGTAIAIAVGGVTVMFLAGVNARLFVGGIVAGLAALPILFSMLHDYQRKRVLTFLNPESDPLGTGYHITQSKITIGSGGFWGKGLLNGTQAHLDYLPEGHTDFVFATMAEEWGMFGGILVIGGFLLLMRWGWSVAQRSPSRFGRLTAGGLTMAVFFYVAINLLMVMGLAPVVGIPLPFISYGGSSMLTVLVCIGLIMGVDRQTKARRVGDLR